MLERYGLFCLTAFIIFILGNLAAWMLCRIAAQSDKRMEEQAND